MRPEKHTLSATAAIAAALALSASPLAAQDAAPATVPAPTVQAQPATPPAPIPAPTIEIPDVTAAPAVSGAGTETTVETPDVPPVAETATPETPAKPAAKPASRTTSTRTTTVSRGAAPVAAAPVAAVPLSADDLAALPADSAQAEPVAPTPTQSNDTVGMLGVVLLALLALAILAAGLLFFRRRHPAITESEPEALEPAAEEPVIAATTVEPTPVYTPMASGAFRRRDMAPVAGALPSDGASVDLPPRAPEAYEERSALLEKMVAAAPDKANPFTDRKQRLHRARLILQSLGTTFDREPRIDLSQYPNNWPELARQYHKAA